MTDVRYEVRGATAWLTIDRPAHRNALRARTIDELTEGLHRASEDEVVRVLCLTGAGDSAFCAGADLAEASAQGAGAEDALGLRRYAGLLEAMTASEKPLVARVAGHCIGGGVGLALACDVVYAAEDVRIGTPEVGVGLFPMMVAALLPRGASRQKILEMIYTGALVTATEAEQMGLIARAIPRDALDAKVSGTLEAIGSKAPLALTSGRLAWTATEDMPVAEALRYLCGELETLMKTDDAAEGIRAFAEKRAPRWTGK